MLLFAWHLRVIYIDLLHPYVKSWPTMNQKRQKLQYGQYGRVQKLEETADHRGGTLKSSSRKSRIWWHFGFPAVSCHSSHTSKNCRAKLRGIFRPLRRNEFSLSQFMGAPAATATVARPTCSLHPIEHCCPQGKQRATADRSQASHFHASTLVAY